MTCLDRTPQDDGWLLPVAGQKVTCCCVDNEAIRLLCLNMIEFSIGETFTLFTPDGGRYALDPGGNPANLAPILQITRQVIRRAIAFNDGRLELDFDNGSRINVPPGQEYEAWTLAGPGGPQGLKVVSVPGGDLAIWADGR